jgi:hypothetical protein
MVNGELGRIRKIGGRSLTHVISRQMTGRDEENHDTLRRMYDVPAGIRAGYLPHTSTKRCRIRQPARRLVAHESEQLQQCPIHYINNSLAY